MSPNKPESIQLSDRRSYRRDIDGLRAISILAVVFFHAGVPFLKGGFVGVDIFFVISGYLIGAHIYSDICRDRFSLASFYSRRAKRILPALLAVIAFCYVAAVFLLTPTEIENFCSYAIAAISSSANILAFLKANYFATGADQKPLLMTWSLGVEEQFYILFPLLMIVLSRKRRAVVFNVVLALVLVSLLGSVFGTARFPGAAFYMLPARAWELGTGILLALYENGRNPERLYFSQRFANAASVVAVLLIAGAVFLFDSHTVFPGFAAAAPVFGAALILSAPTSYFNRFVLSAAPFVFLGQVSYSFYLWHWPLLSFAQIVSDHPISVSAGCAIVLISLGISWLSYLFVEQPFRRSTMANGPLLGRYALVCLAMLLPALALRAAQGWPGRFPHLGEVSAANDSVAHGCVGTSSSPDLSRACMDKDDPRPAVALIGDSHAAALAPQIRQISERAGMKMYELIKYSCAPLVGMSRVIDTEEQERECIQYNSEVLSLLRRDPQVKTVVITAYWAGPTIDDVGYVTANDLSRSTPATDNDHELYQGLAGTVSALRASGKDVILIQDVPVFRFDPIRRMVSNSIPLRGYLASHLFASGGSESSAPRAETFEMAQRSAAQTVNEVADADSVAVFDPGTNLCSASRCRFVEENVPLYGDKQHLTPAGAEKALVSLSVAPGATVRRSNQAYASRPADPR